MVRTKMGKAHLGGKDKIVLCNPRRVPSPIGDGWL